MFWLTESEANPKHVAGLQILEIPQGAPANYIDRLFTELQRFDKAASPFNCRVRSILAYPIKFTPLKNLDMEYHLQLHEIEDISNKPDLHKFVATLHETWLDRDKPLWQYHLIKDKVKKGFAIYVKVHHMCGDGATLIRLFQKGYSEQQSNENFLPVWAAGTAPRNREKINIFRLLVSGLWGLIVTVKDLLWMCFRLLLKLIRINQDYMPIPFSGKKTILTGQVKKGRVVSSLDIDFARIVALSKRLRASANEIMLCSFDIGAHRFLKDYGYTFDKALLTNMPINLRKPGETTPGNKIAIVPVELAYGEKDPYLRLRQIIENHRVVKRAAKVSHPGAFSYYTLLIQSFSTLFEILHISDWVRPIGNILVSNMPGPAKTLYFKDAKLIATYPISAMTPGGGVNITMITYNGIAQFGLVCCNSKISSLEPMALYFQEAFNMLEACVDDPSLNVDDIGEEEPESPQTLIDDDAFNIKTEQP
jgi:WS/DGAT/MGAT family acyltransferase